MIWQVDDIVILKRKKKNGYPKGIEIGEKIEVVGVATSNGHDQSNVMYLIKGKKRTGDTFKLHSSFVMDVVEYRNKIINEILTDE